MQNDTRNIEEIYHHYGKMVYNLALHYLQNVEEAEEITQDVFVKAHQNMNRFREEASLKTYLYRITVNHCLDWLRHKKSKKRWFVFGSKPDKPETMERLPDFEHPGILMERQEDAAILFAAINHLPENQKTAFLLSKVDGLSNIQTAAIMKVSVGAVESLLFRAKAKLQQDLSDKISGWRRKK